jgi:uncharacterized membrane protein YdjX (TVP38/TMEM64 family)
MQSRLKWALLSLVILLIILIPFLLLGESIETWTNYLLRSSSPKLLIGMIIGGLLSIDILAPIPSSIVSTAGGYFLGFKWGIIVSTAGMTISCIIGYLLGAKIGTPISKWFVGTNELLRLEKLQNKYGDWIVILSRAVPVLAEASVLIAGIGRMHIKRFILLILLSNLGISIVYSFIGAYSGYINSFLLAFAGAILLPGTAMAIFKIKFNKNE